MVRPKRTLGSYQAGTSSTYAREMDATSQNGFDDVLNRHRHSRHHKATRESALQASMEMGSASSFAPRGNAASRPQRSPDTLATHLWSMPSPVPGFESNVSWDVQSSLSDSRNDVADDSISRCRVVNKPVNMHAAGRLYRRVHHPASARGPKGGDTELRSSFPSSSPKPSSRLAKPERFSNETCPIQTESDNNLLNHTVDRDCYRAVSASFAGESALIEHLIVEYASLLGTGFDTDDVDMMYEQPRLAPAVP